MSSQLTTQEDLTPGEFDLMFRRARYGKYMSKTLAARRIQTRYRRYRSGAPTTSPGATLGRLVRQHRYANPMQLQLSNARTCSFTRTVNYSIALNESTGFASTSKNLNWGFCLGSVNGWLGGIYSINTPVSSTSEFQALFDYYKIASVRMKIYFTNNTSNVSTANTGLPLLHICNDFDDVSEGMTTNSILERGGVRTSQFDANNTKGITHWVKPVPTSVIVQVNPDTGAFTSSSSGIPQSQWLDCASSNIIHNGVKIVYNSQGRNNNTDLGSVTFIFEIEYVFKGYR